MKTALFAMIAMAFLSGCSVVDAPAAAPTATAAPAPAAAPLPTDVPIATVAPSPTRKPLPPTATPVPPTATPTTLMVNAGGDGVFIRIVPEKPDRYKAWADGTTMLVVGNDRTVGGQNWKNVQDPDGNVGWVPDQYLKQAPASTPAAG